MTMRPTEASERCQLWGSYTLRAGESALELWGGPESGTQLCEWPYRFLRRFGRDKVSGVGVGGLPRAGERKDECQGEGEGALRGRGNRGGRNDEMKAGRRETARPRGWGREPRQGEMVVEVGEKERRGRGGERWEGDEWLAWWRMNSTSSFILGWMGGRRRKDERGLCL